MHIMLLCARSKLRSAMCEPKIDQRASTNVRSQKKFVRENLKRIIFECSNIRCSSSVVSAVGSDYAGGGSGLDLQGEAFL